MLRTRLLRRRPWVVALVLGLSWAPALAEAPARGALTTGFADPDAFQEQQSSERAEALRHAREARGSLIRVMMSWAEIAPLPPPSRAAARRPAWPGYRWDRVDSIVREVVAAGLRPVLNPSGAPGWAEGPARPPLSEAVPAGSWRPSATAFRDFAQALATRYSGFQPDPGRPGQFLPRARHFQGWNEPNLWLYLTPQWRRRGRGLLPESPDIYRALLNGFYAGVKDAQPRSTVVTAGTAPYGDPLAGGRRIPPALFTRELLCLRGRERPRRRRCAQGGARFDALSHHVYSVGGPGRAALNLDDVLVPDFRKLTLPLRTAVRAGTARPRRAKQLWVTEISWDSSPPDPGGVPAALHARYLAGAFHQLWRQGVDAVFWWQLRDSARGRGYEHTLQSGLFERGATVAADRPKPALQAFRFPFAAYRSRRSTLLWGLAPAPGKVVVDLKRQGRWRPITRLRAGRSRQFSARRRGLRAGALLRARARGESSPTWRLP